MKIGFKNFKKFKNFPMIELAPITFLVGPNNSGKSSFIKALTFFLTNQKNQKIDKPQEDSHDSFQVNSLWMKEVSFHHMTLSHLGFGDFTTCLNDADGSHIISFQVEDDCSDNIIYEFSFGASKKELSENQSLLLQLPVKSWRTIFKKQGIEVCTFFIDDKWHTTIKFDKDEWLPSIIKIIDEIKSRTANGEIDMDAARKIIDLEERLMSSLNNDSSNIGLIDHTPDISNSLLAQTLWCAVKHENIEGPSFDFTDVEYIETRNANHSQILLADNKNDYLARTIVEFFKSIEINENSVNTSHYNNHIYMWCLKWMKAFEIGESFKINPLAGGEAFTVNIRKIKHQTKHRYKIDDLVNLATLGTGAIQLFTLILRIGLAMSKLMYNRQEKCYIGNIPIIVEEPEQNLHPAFQSKLADLFKDAYETTNGCVKFIIETHSEYLIRRTQVLVAEQNYADDIKLEEKNPFKVYYFPEEGLPYDMKYCIDGCFEEEFGDGFFDEASKLAFKLF